MRFHLPALPGRSIGRENSSCAYSQKIRKFVRMMEPLGHECLTYEHPGEPIPFEGDWTAPNAAMALQIGTNSDERDVLCIAAGSAQRSLAEALPLLACEPFVGYGGTLTERRVFESYAWMHTVYGAQQGAHSADGVCFDEVIPNYFEVEDFPAGHGAGDYLLYVGRMTERKGVMLAAEVAKATGLEIIFAGEGECIPEHGEHVGSVGPEERGVLMAGARALLAPTLYVEPFGGVVAEAQLCGTPTITTDWGAFTETVENGRNGYRCRMFGEFVAATEAALELDRAAIRAEAIATYSLEAVGPRFDDYFNRLGELWGEGFYSESYRKRVP